ncbi:DNA (cytosine-5-)-methyltransferase [Thermosynechococcaceae cyanobacterium Okahandja]
MTRLTFIDLFAGIGGMRLGFTQAGAECVFSSEWNKFAQMTYEANFLEKPLGDITKISNSEIPDHDILLAGFPCQPFSIAGVSKHNALGINHGFNHPTQGNLFFEIVRILADKKPKAFLLENVKNLQSHDKGRTFKIIHKILDDLGYYIYYKVIDAVHFVPQHRERIFIVGFREPIEFTFPQLQTSSLRVKDILEIEVPAKYTLTDHLWNYLQQYAQKHREKGNGFGYGLVNLDGITRTLSARYYKDGSEILIPQVNQNPRRLTPRECARLMGFPDSFKIVVSDTRAYQQFGNSVVVPLVKAIADRMLDALNQSNLLKITKQLSLL